MPYEARLLFIGLWCLADCEGRLEHRAKRISAEIFPFEHVNIEKLLSVIAGRGFTFHYENEGKRYIQVINFKKHQNTHPHEAKSILPPCNYKAVTCNDITRLSRADVMNPSSLNHESLYPAITDIAGVFDSVWREYPKRLGRKQALSHFNASVKNEVDVAAIQVALAKYKKHIQGKERQYIQHGSTWFNNWRDWINFEEESHGPHDSKSPVSYAALARAKREAEKVRENPPAGSVPNGGGNLSELPVGSESSR